MKLSALIEGLPIELKRGSSDVEISGIVEDSRLIKGDCLFIARTGGMHDGRCFIAEAVGRGAIAALSFDLEAIPEGVAALVAEDVPRATAMLAERFFDHPSRDLRLVGITGTNGKTTTAHLVYQILNRSGVSCGQMGTVQTDDGRTIKPTRLTTPPPLEISALLRAMVGHGCAACVMEASSHALDQQRTAGLDFQIGVFTNLTGDHMDYHGTPEQYLEAKCLLFRQLPGDGWGVVNIDDPASAAFIDCGPDRILRTSLLDESADCFADIGDQSIQGIKTSLRGPWGSCDVFMPLIGRFNVGNALQAAAVCHLLDLDPAMIAEGLAKCTPPPGRLEPMDRGESAYTVLVDYAHTDDALDNALGALKPIVPPGGRLITVFGCGGDRDRTKRPRMANVACRWSDHVIITSDNPRTEDPQAIIDEILAGVPQNHETDLTCFVDRRAAIRHAVVLARDDDVVLIAGKGHEDYQIIGREVLPFDDRAEARLAMKARRSEARVS